MQTRCQSVQIARKTPATLQAMRAARYAATVATIVTCVALASGCAGRTAHPVASGSPSDKTLSCKQIEAEIAANVDQIQDLGVEKSSRRKRNIGLGIGGIFLFPVWFFLDLGNAQEEEEAALRKRNNNLKRVAGRIEGCEIYSG